MTKLRKIETQVLEIIQQDFPLTPRPYEELARRLGSSEDEVFKAVQSLRKKGIIRRLGGSFDSRKIGYKSTLVALSVPKTRLQEVVTIVNSYPGVTHNYEREGKYNVWFTLIAESEQAIEETIAEIRNKTGAEIINLPATHLFKIKVDFDLGNNDE
ncbi:MAG: Lrp/AsnC family transcriptional regulator [Candidatus Abyssobacteria bacterium SURF_17]|jgi:DNA-binding Lrp family transcriptional regulator|uniref:siroheme decarboxylase n=1 Tax=Candidatus Abyssobacteria bacterium SURF_17 TaxID=2093361 RepID=A0A419F0Y5_9BACT|nr:MAG: Lrp/AsnC family transcriptional regulator [Candidatus Abyssubacteria bacterium SURF_17]